MSRRSQPLCSCCKNAPPVNNQAYCALCRNWINRKHHKKWGDMTQEERKKAGARSCAKMAQRRGTLIPQPCEVEGCTTPAEKHHDDYSRPLEVRWLCPAHHRQLHQKSA